ncbi:BamA/TamA family outer membrane protein [Marinoscillum sp. MHG1-6]|uniref:BamA/TamA family outer membrane protein n=1 Tax=Marinoscillum sp. MHG1-6 TaxID=2959627 RepID=UPI002157DEB0|nr:BamA/TamA family outer membrane protein [Marinoscillum sp. MHG1-6]
MKGRYRLLFLVLIIVCYVSEVTAQSLEELPPINLDTVPNPKVLVSNIFIIGNKKTKESIITRELSFEKGDSLTMHQLIGYQTEDRNKIYNTNIFNTVELQILELDKSTVNVLVKVTERWYTYPNIIFKLSDRNFNDWWVNRDHDLSRVNYGARLSQYNFRGRDETVLLTAQFGFERVFLLDYTMPYIDKSQRVGLNLVAGYGEYNNIAYRTIDHLPAFLLSREQQRRTFSTSATANYRKSFYSRHYLSTGFYSSHISDSVNTLNPDFFGNGDRTQRYFSLSYSFSRDYRDNHTYPLKGDLLVFTVGKNGLGIFNDFDRWYLQASYYKYLALGKGFYLGSYFSSRFSSKNDVPYSRYYEFGIENYLVRGYELSVVEGYEAFLFKNSFKKRVFKTAFNVPDQLMPLKQFRRWPMALYIKTFFDAGYVRNYPNYELNSRLSNKALYSVGVGVDFVTIHDLTIRLEESYNAEGDFHFVLNFKHDL